MSEVDKLSVILDTLSELYEKIDFYKTAASVLELYPDLNLRHNDCFGDYIISDTVEIDGCDICDNRLFFFGWYNSTKIYKKTTFDLDDLKGVYDMYGEKAHIMATRLMINNKTYQEPEGIILPYRAEFE